MVDILHQLSSEFDLILIDTPPTLAVTDALVLAPRVDGVLLVFKPNISKRAAVRRSIEQLRQVNANLIGVVVNDVKMTCSRYYYYYHYHGYDYSGKYGQSDQTPKPVSEPVKNPEVTIQGSDDQTRLLQPALINSPKKKKE